MECLERGDRASCFGDRIARIDDDDVDARARHSVEDLRRPVQDLDVESTAREQESGDTAESCVARRHEHPQRSQRPDVPDVSPLFHDLRHGP